MGYALSVEFTQESKLLINRLVRVGKFSLLPIFKVMGIAYRKAVKDIFDKKMPRDPELRWKPLSAQYAKWKKKKFGDKPILRATDRLYNSMINKSHEENIEILTPVSAEFGSKVPYAKYHDSLPPESHKKMPFRNFTIPNQRTIASLMNMLNSATVKQFQIAGIHVKEAIIR